MARSERREAAKALGIPWDQFKKLSIVEQQRKIEEAASTAPQEVVVGSSAPKSAPSPSVLASSEPEWHQPLNRADSIGLLGFLVGLFFVLVVPTVWIKVPAFLLLCACSVYLIWLSHWTYKKNNHLKIVVALAVMATMGLVAVPQFVTQWQAEHMRSQLVFTASAPGVAYPEGDRHGIKWLKTFSELRLVITSNAPFPIQNLNLSVWGTDKPKALAGMALTDDLEGCVTRAPRMGGIPPFVLRGVDGSRADISPEFNDEINKSWKIRDHYDLLCQRILAKEPVAVIIAALPVEGSSSRLRIEGDYETTPTEVSKRVHFDEVVNVSDLKPWK